ncbi:hypothetical protein CLV67_121115 [Actinoplanes italicus]|uniref:Uncharacterized protein n=1 Tax=Actinoplanes italicus TaxID=113567 RepID=A0A2T0K014_9ACTN|nr:hypothetical protein CLV67_121115 [Actinoplanes italicus]
MTGFRELRNGTTRCRAGAGPRPGVSCWSWGRYDAGRTARAVRWRSRRRVSVDEVAPVARPNCWNERDHCAHLGRGYPFPDVRNRSGRIHDGRNRARPAPRAGRARSGSRRAAPARESGPPPARPADPARPESGAPHDGPERNRATCRAGVGAGPRATRAGVRRRREAARCGCRWVCEAEPDERWRWSGTAPDWSRRASPSRARQSQGSRHSRGLTGRPAWVRGCFGRTHVVVILKGTSTVLGRDPDRWARAAPDRWRVAGGTAPPWPPAGRRR